MIPFDVLTSYLHTDFFLHDMPSSTDSTKLLTMWSTHWTNTVNIVVIFDNMVNDIVTKLFRILSISTILLLYDNNIVAQSQ